MTVVPKDQAACYQALYDKGTNKGTANKQGWEVVEDNVAERQIKAVNCSDYFDKRMAPLSHVDVTNNASSPF